MSGLPSANSIRAFLLGVILSCYRPAWSGSVWEWAERNVVLTRKQSPGNPGPYRSELNPYTRTVQDFFTDPDWDELIVMKSSQTGVSEAVLNGVRHSVAEKPTNILYMLDSQGEAKKVCRTRLQPTIDKFIPPDLIDVVEPDGQQTLMLDLPHMTIYFAGGFSGGAIAGKPCGIVIVEEMEEHPAPKPGDQESIDQGRERLKTVDDGKLIGIGRPKVEGGVTSREHANGTCEVFDVPCPSCGAMQELTRKGLSYEHCKDMLGEYDLQRVLKETVYSCEKCQHGIREEDRYAMNLKGVWRITNLKHKPRKRSIHISDLYSPFASWGELAVEYVEAKKSGSQKKLQAFYNARLGRPWKQGKTEVKEADVLKLRGPYRRGTCPFPRSETALIADLTDKQGDVHKTVRCAFKESGEMAVIDYAIVGSEDDLLSRAREPVMIFAGECSKEGEGWAPTVGMIDEGFEAKIAVRDFVLRSEGLYWPSKGRAGMYQVKGVVWESKTPHAGQIMIVYHFDDDGFKRQLYGERIGNFDKIITGEVRTPRLWLPEDIDRDFVLELCSEQLVEEKTAYGFPKWIWKKTGANDFGDALKLALVMWYWLGHRPATPTEAEAAEAEAKAA